MKEYVDESIKITTSDNLREAYDHELANMEQQYSYGYDDGLEKGIEQKARESAINFYNLGVEKSKITQALNITLEQLDDYLKGSLSKNDDEQ